VIGANPLQVLCALNMHSKIENAALVQLV
jgi:hypothetical protein